MYGRVISNYPGSSALGVFPPLKSPADLKNMAIDEPTKRAIKEISEYLKYYLEKNEDNIDGGPRRFPPAIPGLKLNFEQANNVIHHLNSEFKIIGALHVASINSILFQTKFGSFGLEYGPNAFRSETGCYILHHEFDEARGFVPFNEIIPRQEEVYMEKVTQILQEHYSKWCLNNKKGFIVPDMQSCSLSNFNKVGPSYWKYGKYAGALLVASI